MLPVTAFAETNRYTNKQNGYTVLYPADWILLSQETIDSVKQRMSFDDIPGVNAELLNTYQDQIMALDMMIVLSDDGMFNFNVVYENTGQTITNEEIITYVCPSVLAQFYEIFHDVHVQDSGSLYRLWSRIRPREYVRIAASYLIDGDPYDVEQYYLISGTILYYITFTKTNWEMGAHRDMAATVREILSTFSPSASVTP
jgi:hypothetical protein